MPQEESVEYVLEHDRSNAAILQRKRKKPTSTPRSDGGQHKTANKRKKISVKKATKLTKKLRRQQKFADYQKKRVGRSIHLKDLRSCQAPSEELEQYAAVSDVNKLRLEEKQSRKAQKRLNKQPVLESHSDAIEQDVLISSVRNSVIDACSIPQTSCYQNATQSFQPKTTAVSSNVTSASIVIQSAAQTDSRVKSVPAVYVSVTRSADVNKLRNELPIIAEEATIVEAVRDNSVVIICGETGSGKTTQVPQFLFEAGFTANGALIGVTEPRRVAAISMARRVQYELGSSVTDDTVGYQIRFEGNVTPNSRIKFMTDGVLLRELKEDFLLSKYAVIILDEAHERSMYTDILIGLLSRIVPLRIKRKLLPLKLVIMSATLRVDDFTAQHLFDPPPTVISVNARQFPVTAFFNRVTSPDYLRMAFRKVSQIHRALPDGGILVFVSGKQEVHQLIAWLERAFPRSESLSQLDTNGEATTAGCARRSKKRRRRQDSIRNAPNINLDDYQTVRISVDDTPLTDFNEADVMDQDDVLDVDDSCTADPFAEAIVAGPPLYCLPVYSMLPTNIQQNIFLPPPAGCRLCIVATNVAETSLTIPNIKYVVDCGKEKVRRYDTVTGVSRFDVQWISKASANQRAGRAGRTERGFCYRLYSSAVFQHEFADFRLPDIVTKPSDELVLQMKSLGIAKVAKFPFPTAPDGPAIEHATRRLVKLGLLENVSSFDGQANASLTELGSTVAKIPLHPCFGKILALSQQHNLQPFAICLVAALSVREPLVNLCELALQASGSTNEADHSGQRNLIARLANVRKIWAGTGICSCLSSESLLFGDLGILLKAVGATVFEKFSADFCEKFGLRHKAMLEIEKLRRQLTQLMHALQHDSEDSADVRLAPLPIPNEKDIRLLRQLVLSGLGENVAKRASDETAPSKCAYRRPDMEDALFIHPSSVLRKVQPEYVIYQEILETQQKKYMFNVMAIEPEWLPLYAEGYCTVVPEVATKSEPRYDASVDKLLVPAKANFGPWLLPSTLVPHANNMDYYRSFAKALLLGEVVPLFSKFTASLNASPHIITKPWAKCDPKVTKIVHRLALSSVRSRHELQRMWQKDDSFLYDEISAWLNSSAQASFDNIWSLVKSKS